jgi:hypothetical protein
VQKQAAVEVLRAPTNPSVLCSLRVARRRATDLFLLGRSAKLTSSAQGIVELSLPAWGAEQQAAEPPVAA